MRSIDLVSKMERLLKKKYQDLRIFFSVYKFYRQNKAIIKLKKLNKGYKKKIKKYYSKYGITINFVFHRYFNSLGLDENVRYIPYDLYKKLMYKMNDFDIVDSYNDKNLLYELLPSAANLPSPIVKVINGNVFDCDDNLIFNKDDVLLSDGNYIIKNSRTNNGVSVNSLEVYNKQFFYNSIPCDFQNIIERYGTNFLIQEKLDQHSFIKKFHPCSINTIRVVTLRLEDKILNVLNFIRFGNNFSVKDNAGAGGIVCGIDSKGYLHNLAYNAFGDKYESHPLTNIPFEGKVPYIEKAINKAIELHKNVLHHNFLSWDVVISENGTPRIIEVNFRGATWLYQLALSRPLFGEHTDKVLEHYGQNL